MESCVELTLQDSLWGRAELWGVCRVYVMHPVRMNGSMFFLK